MSINKPIVNQVYTGKVKAITDYGVFIEFLPNTQGLLHISEIGFQRIKDLKQLFRVDDEVEVKLLEIDEERNRYRLSKKALLQG